MNIKSGLIFLLCCLAMPAFAQTISADKTAQTSVQGDVFPIDFMKSLMKCKEGAQSSRERVLKIIGKENDRCRLQYADFDLFVPFSLLGNIHSFEDVETLLKNKDIAKYGYKADYIYDGITYALDSCFQKKDFDGRQEVLADDFVTINRGIIAEFVNEICSIRLINQQDIDGVVTDYGVVCRLSYKDVQNLEPYFKDVVAKYGEKRSRNAGGRIMVTRAVQNKETHNADAALMYYMQQNGFCTKNNR